MKPSIPISILCTLLIMLWVYAALSKLAEFTAFGYELQRQPLPQWSIPLLKWSLPVMELFTAVLIYFQRARLAGLIMSSCLMVAFTLYVAIALSGAFGDIPCSCAGIIATLKWQGHLLFNIIFTILSVAAVYLQIHKDNRFIKHKPMTV